jgi:hypothetical protein
MQVPRDPFFAMVREASERRVNHGEKQLKFRNPLNLYNSVQY